MKSVVRFSRVGILALITFVLVANSSGRMGKWAGAPTDAGTCSTCHTSAVGSNLATSGIVLGNVPDAIAAGQQYDMTLTLSDSDPGDMGGNRFGGFQIVAVNGDLSSGNMVGTFTPSGDTKLNDQNRLVQNAKKEMVGGTTSWDIVWTAPASPPSSVAFFFAGNAANNDISNGVGDHGGYSSSTAPILLPVTFQSFTATRTSAATELQWTTARELNNDYFAIERSTDANEWTEIATVLGSGTVETEQQYRYIDAAVPSAKVIYYRLKQIDFDGQFSYSNTVSVSNYETEDEVLVFPNPVAAGATITVGLPLSTQGLVRVFDAGGAEVLRRNASTERAQLTLDLTPGLYFVQVGERTERLIVQ